MKTLRRRRLKRQTDPTIAERSHSYDVDADIDATLDQLIKNATAMRHVEEGSHLAQALHKTQESLFARLLHLDSLSDRGSHRHPEKRSLLLELSHVSKEGVNR